MIDNLKDAIRMVKSAGAKNGGLIIDIYQVKHLGMSYEEISRIPLQHLINVELNDGTLLGNPEYDPSDRRFCGEGEYDIRGLIQCVKKMDYTGPWGGGGDGGKAGGTALGRGMHKSISDQYGVIC